MDIKPTQIMSIDIIFILYYLVSVNKLHTYIHAPASRCMQMQMKLHEISCKNVM